MFEPTYKIDHTKCMNDHTGCITIHVEKLQSRLKAGRHAGYTKLNGEIRWIKVDSQGEQGRRGVEWVTGRVPLGLYLQPGKLTIRLATRLEWRMIKDVRSSNLIRQLCDTGYKGSGGGRCESISIFIVAQRTKSRNTRHRKICFGQMRVFIPEHDGTTPHCKLGKWGLVKELHHAVLFRFCGAPMHQSFSSTWVSTTISATSMAALNRTYEWDHSIFCPSICIQCQSIIYADVNPKIKELFPRGTYAAILSSDPHLVPTRHNIWKWSEFFW